MVDDATDDTSIDGAGLSRRSYLAAGVLGTGLAGGYAGYRGLRDDADDANDNAESNAPPASSRRAGPREDFLWLGAGLWQDEPIRENLYAFARRHDLAVVLVATHPDDGSLAEKLEAPMVAASEFGLDVWLNVGLLSEVPADRLATDGQAREAHLEQLRAVARRHGELFDGGRAICWQEAPVMGEWVEGGEWNEAAVQNLLEYGPEIFAAQAGAVREANDALEVGPFVHFPYIVDSKRPEVFAALADGFRDQDADPDFGFVDFYRGWYEKDVGSGPANAAVRSLVSNVRTELERPVFYLGQSHTVNPNHTPSKQSLRMNLRASLEAGAAGVGWYVRNGYVPTESGFDPFVPNVEGAEVDGDSVNTLTIARDRVLYAWLATLEAQDGFDAADAFDLWLIGDGFDFYDHRLAVRTAEGGEDGGDGESAWEYVGDIGGYADGDYPDGSMVTDRATVFRALDRERLLSGGELECRVETADDSEGADLLAAYAMPCDPDAYVAEQEAAALALGDDGGVDDAALEEVCLGRTTDGLALEPDERQQFTIPIADSDASSLRALCYPDHADVVQELASFEADAGVDRSARFDLWMRGSGLGESENLPAVVDGNGDKHASTDVGIVTATDSVALCYGLERDRFLADGLELAADGDGAVEAAYAMPYAGSTTFRPPARAADLLAEQPEEAEIYCLERVTRD
ncbi:hypothetical protein [Halopiger xanaduensis]|uniref:Uncharacterized protein n=1 Tax=Halopiger xanaduensis (strain DSM 18323 / JCM 14033 / SH-6) TaxID=797210 RepID=F8D6M6_HALXS|nr:hypothetical protein [Halopiger xanaduensis]AEH37766.1 hypothetical protein Halxa_3153 [Halopiger xanaduensis SH-6]